MLIKFIFSHCLSFRNAVMVMGSGLQYCIILNIALKGVKTTIGCVDEWLEHKEYITRARCRHVIARGNNKKPILASAIGKTIIWV